MAESKARNYLVSFVVTATNGQDFHGDIPVTMIPNPTISHAERIAWIRHSILQQLPNSESVGIITIANIMNLDALFL